MKKFEGSLGNQPLLQGTKKWKHGVNAKILVPQTHSTAATISKGGRKENNNFKEKNTNKNKIIHRKI